jgi:hypothetical protein
MKHMMARAALGLVVCVALMAMTTGVKAGEILPHVYRSSETIVVDMVTGEGVYTGDGVATHFGRLLNEGSAQVDFETGAFHTEGGGTTSNGDQVFWVGDGNLYTGEMLVTLTGGTGRFEGATGELSCWELTNQAQFVDDGNVIMTMDAWATGWISY